MIKNNGIGAEGTNLKKMSPDGNTGSKGLLAKNQASYQQN